jgi:hypothetical protein
MIYPSRCISTKQYHTQQLTNSNTPFHNISATCIVHVYCIFTVTHTVEIFIPVLIYLHIHSNCIKKFLHDSHTTFFLPSLLLLPQHNMYSICICTCPPPPYVYFSPCVVMTSTQVGEGGRCCSGAGWDTTGAGWDTTAARL